MAGDPRAVRLARRRMLITSKPKPRITLPVRGFKRKRKDGRIQKVNPKQPLRLRVRR